MSDELIDQEQPKRGRKPAVQVTSRKNAALARRLAPGANPQASLSRDIPMKEPHRWQLYIASEHVAPDRLFRMVHELGWDPLRPEDLACKPEEIGYRVSEDGHLVRGTQGKEMIFKMPKEDYHALQMRKAEQNSVGIGSASKTKTQVAEAVANTFGPEAADFAHQHFTGTVTDTRQSLP